MGKCILTLSFICQVNIVYCIMIKKEKLEKFKLMLLIGLSQPSNKSKLFNLTTILCPNFKGLSIGQSPKIKSHQKSLLQELETNLSSRKCPIQCYLKDC